MCLHIEKSQCLKGEATICGARLLSVSRQLEHTCGTRAQRRTAVGFELTTLNTSVSQGTGSTTEPSPTPQFS